VDMHGPHDHQSLLHPARQLAILDAYGSLAPGRDAFGQLLHRRAGLEAEKAALVVDEKTYAQQLDLLRFQAREIESARLQADEEESVVAEFNRASNAARLLQLSQTVLDGLSEGDDALLTRAGVIGRALQELQRVDPGATALLELHTAALAGYRELQAELSHYAEKAEADPARLTELEERLNLLHSLKRKYGASLAEVLAFGTEAKGRLQSLESRDAELERINLALAKLDAELVRAGRELTARRRAVIPELARAAGRQLEDLGFRQSKFEVSLTAAAQPLASGWDEIEFQFAPNPGEPARALRAIASSGEMARVMLALKTVLAAEDEIPVLVFDEVDANVGGETAHMVGEKMRQIGVKRQVLCITHLPQVAAPADAHYVVTKQLRDGRTISEIARLGEAERVTELARMLGGQSEAARRHAEELLHGEAAPSPARKK